MLNLEFEDIFSLTKELKSNVDQYKIFLIITENITANYQTENDITSINVQRARVSDVSYKEGLDLNKKIFFGEINLIDKCLVNSNSFIGLLESFLRNENYLSKDYETFTEEFINSIIPSSPFEYLGLRDYSNNDDSLIKIEKVVHSERCIDLENNTITFYDFVEQNSIDLNFNILK